MAVIRNNKKFFSNDRFGFKPVKYFLIQSNKYLLNQANNMSSESSQ